MSKIEKNIKEEDMGEELMEVDSSTPLPKKAKSKSSKKCSVLIPSLLVVLTLIIGYLIVVNINNIHSKAFKEKVYTKDTPRRCVVLGYGGVSMSLIPQIVKSIKISEFLIVDQRDIPPEDLKLIEGINYKIMKVSIPNNELYKFVCDTVKDYDILINIFGVVEGIDIIKAANTKKGVIYADASLEESEEKVRPSQAALYKELDDLKERNEIPNLTACCDAGANPGMITHFSILGLYGMARSAIKRGVKDKDIIQKLLDKKDWKGMIKQMKVEAIHISEIEDMEPKNEKDFDGYVSNSWCPSGFALEYNKLPPEVTIGTHEREYFEKYENIKKIPDTKPEMGIITFESFMITASPQRPFVGRAVLHPEVIEISKIFASEDFVPTVAFIYHPNRIARKSLARKDFNSLPFKIMSEITGGPLVGNETMGCTLISAREDIPPRWFGSVVTTEENRRVGCKINPTTLQVVAGLIGHLKFAIEHPDIGVCMPHDFDSAGVLENAKPYLGIIVDKDLSFRLPTKWKDLKSTQDRLNDDF